MIVIVIVQSATIRNQIHIFDIVFLSGFFFPQNATLIVDILHIPLLHNLHSFLVTTR